MSDTKATRTSEEKMMNGVRLASMRKFEEVYSEPPPYSSQPPSTANVNAGAEPPRSIPAIEDLNFEPSPLEIPTPAECIAHLKLLHAFAKLRHDVGNQDGLFGISLEKAASTPTKSQNGDSSLPSYEDRQPGGIHSDDPSAAFETHGSSQIDTALAERIRDKRWAIFVNKAVDRFEAWWDSLSVGYSNNSSVWTFRITTDDFDSTTYNNVGKFTSQGEDLRNTDHSYLPPLDVLMVWHAYMLNPRIFLEDSIRFNKHRLWRSHFPWQAIYEAIDNETYEYIQMDEQKFAQKTRRPWDPFKDDSVKKIICPECASNVWVPWTQPAVTSGPEALESYLTFDTGFSGSSFQQGCGNCGLGISHERLRVGKFINDVENLIEKRRTLPGTILNIWGEPGTTTSGKDIRTHDAFFPNRVVDKCPDFLPATLRQDVSRLTVAGLKDKFQNVMRTPLLIGAINSSQAKPNFIAKSSRIALRKMLSHYWDNSSVFGIDLVGAVLRQGTFVQKMKKLDWLHSPSLMSTTQRLIVKYHRFVRLAADSPKKTVVPTLDVDLAWHTHQLTPQVYYRYTLAETKKFLNHDDKIGESDLHTAFQYTSAAYEKKYGQPYSECSCWYCECTREPLRSNFLNKFSSRRSSLSVDALAEKNFPTNPHTGPHVSAHNALSMAPLVQTQYLFQSQSRGPGQEGSAAQRRRELEALDLQYAKVVKRYQKRKASQEPPSRNNNDAYLYGAYGYPMYYPMPMYVPYYADPGAAYTHSHTTGGGGCGGGGGGGCVAATCAASTSLGACAGGEGTPGCAASCGGHGNADGGCGTCGSGGDGGGGGDGGDGGGGGCGGCGGG